MNRSAHASRTCADKLKLLSDTTRLAIVELLLQAPAQVNELEQRLGVEQSLMSHHLRVLRVAGLVECERTGKAVVYRLAPGVGVRGARTVIELGCCRVSFDAAPKRAR
jgi:DNA-binding transcriptional ArsR family regulator